ncbi:hypothetical protein C8T65DRAFT_725881 [Cerioporus squamosus]|nr:hypothetical protein C8T65DRAFT_725881 [Cerioporus squamosus]
MNLYEHAGLLAQKTERACKEPNVSVDELYKVLDLLKATEYNIRTAINARAPIHRMLPPELILAIFAFVPTAAYDPDDDFQRVCGPYLMKDPTGLLPLTLVCKLWRSLAFDTSTLWSSISCGYHDAYRLFDSDSPYRLPIHFSRIPSDCIGTGPLYVHAEAPDTWPHGPQTSAFLSKHGHSIEELHITLNANARQFNTPQADSEPLPTSLSFSATSLRRLAIHGENRVDEWEDVSRTLFEGTSLNLSSLVLWNVPFLPANAMGPSFTRLVLSRLAMRPGENEGSISIPSLLRFLAVNQSLEQAYLDGIAGCDGGIQSFPAVSMPRLRKLGIPFGVGAAQLLSRLMLSQGCLLRVWGDVRSPDQNEALRAAISGLGWRGTKAHVVWWAELGGADLISVQVLNRAGGGLRVDLSVRGVETREVTQAIRSFLSSPPFVAAEELWLSGTEVVDLLSQSGRAISPLSAVTTLHILGLESLDQHHAGILWPQSTTSQSSEEITLENMPSLTCLHYCLPRNDHILDLITLLNARARANHPLTSLFLSVMPNRASSPESGLRETMEQFVGNVEVGQDLHDRSGFAWWSVVPRECTAKGEVHAWWPIWAEGIARNWGAYPDSLSGRLDVAFGIRAHEGEK